MDLFTPVVPIERQNQSFRNILAYGTPEDLAVLTGWAQGFVDRDGKFVQEFQTTFHSSFWELYVHAVLKERGLSVDFSHSSPDFCITTDGGFCIEAVTAGAPGAASIEHSDLAKTLEAVDDLNRLNRQGIIRLANAFSNKWNKFQSNYSGLSHVQGKPLVLAMAAFDSPAFYFLAVRAIEALLYSHYVDEEKFLKGGGIGPLTADFMESVRKENGTNIDLGLFTSPKYAEISAVLYNPCATWGKVRSMSAESSRVKVMMSTVRRNIASVQPFTLGGSKEELPKENLLDGLHIFHNPYATHPLDPALFRQELVAQSYWDQNGEVVHERANGQLLFRQVAIMMVEPGDQ